MRKLIKRILAHLEQFDCNKEISISKSKDNESYSIDEVFNSL